MARWVKAKELIRMFKRATTPTSSDAPAVGDLWLDTSAATPIVQICTDDSPVTFANIDTGGGGGAPTDATYITQTANGSLSAEQALGSLATGILKSTTVTGVVSIAAAGTDYAAASHTHVLADITDEGALAALNTVGTAQIDNDAVTYAKIQNVSATDKLLGRSSVGAGDVEEITCTAAGRALIDDAAASDQRTTLGLVIGTDVQAFDADLTTLSTSFTTASASGAASLALHEDTDNGTNKVTLIAPASIASDKTITFQDITGTVYVSGGTDVAVADGGTGASDAATALTNLGAAASATTITVAGTANQITSSAGAQDLSANRTWTLSLPADVIIPTVITAPNTGLHLLDTDASHDLIVKPGSNLTVDRTLTITTGDADRTITLSGYTTLSGTNTGDQNLFSTVAVSGQSNVVADTTTDTLTLVAGTNITITTDAAADSVTINASGGGTPGGADTQIQFNDASAFNGDSGLVYNKTSNVLTCDTQITIGGNATAAGKLKLLEDTDDGTSGVTITVPALAADYTLTLPTTDGNADEVLKTDGSGGLSWTPQGSGAPSDAQYVTLATNATLTVERVLTAGDGIKFTDAGAGSTLTIDQDFKPNETIELYEEFLGGHNSTASQLGELGWQSIVSGTGTNVANHTGTFDSTTVCGVMRIETGTTTTGRASLTINPASNNCIAITGGPIIVEGAVRVEDLSNGTETYKIYFGLGDVTGAGDMIDGVYFSYSSADIAGDWQGNVSGTSTRTTLDTNTAVAADTWYRLRIEINSAGTSAEFFINGTSKGTIADANLPTSTELTSLIFKIEKSAGSTERIAYIDYFYFRKDLTANRNT